jgi:quercetin dioxygenase-like cupin family protein
MESNLRTIDEIPFQHLWEGIRGRLLEGERLTLAVVELEPDGEVPSHQHEHEQLGLCIRGEISFRIGDEERTFGPGGTWRIPPNVLHGANVGPVGATVVDVFNPVREDWRDKPIDEDQRSFWP